MTKQPRARRMARTATAAPTEPAGEAATKAPTKQSQVLELLRRAEGAQLSDIVAATGWLPHTARAALTGLKKKGHAIESRRVNKLTTYFLA
ncbi:MAG: DUF3489 domain-containing protein [Rhizorhabdus sp.]